MQLLTEFRNRVAHSQPDHGNVLRRLVRYRGENDSWTLTRDEVVDQWNRAIHCQSWVIAVSGKVADLVASPGDAAGA